MRKKEMPWLVVLRRRVIYTILNSHIKQGIVYLLLYMILEWVVHWTLRDRKGMIFCSSSIFTISKRWSFAMDFVRTVILMRVLGSRLRASYVRTSTVALFDMRARKETTRNVSHDVLSFLHFYLHKRDSLLMESFGLERTQLQAHSDKLIKNGYSRF